MLFFHRKPTGVCERGREKWEKIPLIRDNFTELLLPTPLRACSYQGERGPGNVCLWEGGDSEIKEEAFFKNCWVGGNDCMGKSEYDPGAFEAYFNAPPQYPPL